MSDLLRKNIERKVILTDEEFNLVKKFFTPKTFIKGEFLLQKGEICIYSIFVLSGCLRMYSIDMKGNEHIIQFAVEDWWIGDLESFLGDSPSDFFIDALQDSKVLLITKDAREKMLNAVPKMERFYRLLQEAHFITLKRRINESLSLSAEERYLNLLKSFPALFNRIPQSHIASYLGITPQSLSRIRKELTFKK